MKPAKVIHPDGQVGTITGQITSPEGASQVTITFADGARLVAPLQELIRQDDETYLLPTELARAVDTAASQTELTEEIVIPVVAEELTIKRQRVQRGAVRVHKRVATREEVVDEPTIREEIHVEHVPVNALVEGEPPQPRTEGDVFIIPIIEEVLVVERRLLLREEVHISRRRTTISNPQRVTLRREYVEVERIPAEPEATPDANTASQDLA
ncbi:MAG: YsnF/AvaK domain-containing protein [Oscillochloridaceae bacterium]|nr:YsnF/AvaK domain-containing protein [Chloroflexaceae bacterium]MDW8388827.1 YsnF/AvaK domain-containing protein [Oscillochloridaceae bacterium]